MALWGAVSNTEADVPLTPGPVCAAGSIQGHETLTL